MNLDLKTYNKIINGVNIIGKFGDELLYLESIGSISSKDRFCELKNKVNEVFSVSEIKLILELLDLFCGSLKDKPGFNQLKGTLKLCLG